MTLKQVNLINKKRKAIQSLMVKSARSYAAASEQLVTALEKLPAEELAVFLRKNPDVLLDIGGNVATKAVKAGKAKAKILAKQWKGELSAASKVGMKKAKELGLEMEKKGIAYLRKKGM